MECEFDQNFVETFQIFMNPEHNFTTFKMFQTCPNYRIESLCVNSDERKEEEALPEYEFVIQDMNSASPVQRRKFPMLGDIHESPHETVTTPIKG